VVEDSQDGSREQAGRGENRQDMSDHLMFLRLDTFKRRASSGWRRLACPNSCASLVARGRLIRAMAYFAAGEG
jgi:hypothetical protein